MDYSVDYMQQKDKNEGNGVRAHSTPSSLRRALRDVADDVAAWRKLRGLTQAQLADRSNVSRSTVVRLESGDGGVSLENLLRILRSLGVLDGIVKAFDPYQTDVGRLRSDEQLPQRVRTRDLTRRSNA